MNVLNNPGPSDFYTNDWNSGELLSGLDTAAAVKEIAELKAEYDTRIEPYNTQAYIDLKTGPQNTATDYSQLFGTIGNLGSRMAGQFMRNNAIKDLGKSWGDIGVGSNAFESFVPNSPITGVDLGDIGSSWGNW